MGSGKAETSPLQDLPQGVSAKKDASEHAVRKSPLPEGVGEKIRAEAVACGCNWNDRLRMTGNGVIPVTAAYAFLTLSSRLGVARDLGL